MRIEQIEINELESEVSSKVIEQKNRIGQIEIEQVKWKCKVSKPMEIQQNKIEDRSRIVVESRRNANKMKQEVLDVKYVNDKWK